MPDIRFHTGVEDRTHYLCRLLRKAARQGSRVLVRGEALEVDLLDKALWTFEAQDFVPHHRLRTGQVLPARLYRTPVWLMDEQGVWPDAVPAAQVLVQLCPEPASDVDRWERIIEVVSAQEDDRRQARRRWRAYESQGCAVMAVTSGGAA